MYRLLQISIQFQIVLLYPFLVILPRDSGGKIFKAVVKPSIWGPVKSEQYIRKNWSYKKTCDTSIDTYLKDS